MAAPPDSKQRIEREKRMKENIQEYKKEKIGKHRRIQTVGINNQKGDEVIKETVKQIKKIEENDKKTRGKRN